MSNQHFDVRDTCPACERHSFNFLYKSEYAESPIRDYLNDFYGDQGGVEFEFLQGAQYELVQCTHCDLIFQKQIPGPALMDRLYEQWIDPETVRQMHLNNDPLKKYTNDAEEVATIISWYNCIPTQLKFLDFGMGWAQWALIAKSFGVQSYGAELSPARIENAQKNGIGIKTWDEIPGSDFDFINTEQVLEHVGQPLHILKHLASGLKSGGVVKISVPTDKKIDEKIKTLDWKKVKGKYPLNALAPLEHINYFQYSTFHEMAKLAGLKEVNFSGKNRHVFTKKSKLFSRGLKEWLFPSKRNKNYIFLQKN